MRKASTTLILSLFITLPVAAQESSQKRPNLLVDVSKAAVNRAVERTVDRVDAVDEVIQDAPVHGVSRTVAKVSAELIPDDLHGVVDVVLCGNIYSRGTATRPHVLISSSTFSTMAVRRRVVIDSWGIREYAGAWHADANIQVEHIASHSELGGPAIWIAERMVVRNKQAAEAESAGKAAARTSWRMHEELTPTLASASKSISGGVTKLKRAGLALDSFEFSTTPDFVQSRLQFAAPRQASPAPPLPADFDVGLRVHESLINGAAAAAFGGHSFALDEVNNLYEGVTRGLLRDGRKESDKKESLKSLEKSLTGIAGKPTVISLAKSAPLVVAFAGQGFTIEINVESIRQDAVTYAGSQVKAAYRLENAPDGVHLVRLGPVRIIPRTPRASEQKPNVAFMLLQEVLFTEVLKERLILGDVPMPGALAKVALQAPRAGARDGWLGVIWNLK